MRNYEGKVKTSASVMEDVAQLPNSNPSSRRRPKGRFGVNGGSKSNYHAQKMVVAHTDDRDEDFATGNALQTGHRQKVKPHYSGYKQHYHRRPQSQASEGSWRSKNPPSERPLTAHDVANRLKNIGESSQVTLQRSGDLVTGEEPKSSLNAEAKPFVPSFKPKPVQLPNNMAKLGKVKKRPPRRYQVKSAADSATNVTEENLTNNTSKAEIKRNLPHGNTKQLSTDSSPMGAAAGAISSKFKNPKDEHHTTDSSDYQESNRYYLKQRQAENKQRLKQNNKKSKNSEVGETKFDKVDSSGSTERKQSNKKSQYAYLHDFKERKPTNAVTVENQRESMIETLTNATYECTICCSSIQQQAALWDCITCHHMFHFYCIKKWANTLIAQTSDGKTWRCPTCQEEYNKVPNQYKCFCGKVRDPAWNTYDTPHSCGEVCGKKRADNCPHPCTELCHPGPCPPCNAYTSKHCSCRKSYQKVRCSQQMAVRCSQKCQRKLNCGIHTCVTVCHEGACEPCDLLILQECYCGEEKREVTCGSERAQTDKYSCLKICGKPLACGNHTCTQPCHGGSCMPCSTSPEVVSTCNCGKTKLSDLKEAAARISCLDEIPCCQEKCGKILKCGTRIMDSRPEGMGYHVCELKCHTGECLCGLTSQVRCKCGSKTVEMKCSEAMLFTDDNPYKCEKKCSKKRDCKRHKCGQQCCTLTSHPCLQICGKKLTCGKHKCEELCHIGNCPTCYNVSFDELRCHCGVAVRYPPIPCGAKALDCHEVCTRLHPCDHPVAHNCHSDGECPPCVVLTTKLCMGKHEYRNNIPCYIKDISCGKPCGRMLVCGDHTCPKTCHKDEDCSEQICRQPCPKLRASCGHPCGVPCHAGRECPVSSCGSKVLLTCRCGSRQEQVPCSMKDKKVSVAILAMKQSSEINLSELSKKELQCNENCAQLERNRRMASALDIPNPDLLFELSTTQYSEFLKTLAKKDPVFIAEIERALHDLVEATKECKQERTRSHIFKPMKRDQRQAVHELAELYSCTTVSYDAEPQRNVVAMAHKGKACLPQQTLTSYIRNQQYRRAPMPIPVNASTTDLKLKAQADLQSTTVVKQENRVDYFEMT